MELDASQAPVIGGIEEDDLLHYEGATGFDHKSAEDSVGMYLREIGRVSLLSATEEIALAISMQKGKRASERLAQPSDVRPRVAAGGLAQESVQSRLQAVEHGRASLVIDGTSGECPVAGGAGRPPDSDRSSWEIEW